MLYTSSFRFILTVKYFYSWSFWCSQFIVVYDLRVCSVLYFCSPARSIVHGVFFSTPQCCRKSLWTMFESTGRASQKNRNSFWMWCWQHYTRGEKKMLKCVTPVPPLLEFGKKNFRPRFVRDFYGFARQLSEFERQPLKPRKQNLRDVTPVPRFWISGKWTAYYRHGDSLITKYSCTAPIELSPWR